MVLQEASSDPEISHVGCLRGWLLRSDFIYLISCRKNVGEQGWTEGKVGLWCTHHTASLGQPCSAGRMTSQNFPGSVSGTDSALSHPQSLDTGCPSEKRVWLWLRKFPERIASVLSRDLLPSVLSGGPGRGPRSQFNRLLWGSGHSETNWNTMIRSWFFDLLLNLTIA